MSSIIAPAKRVNLVAAGIVAGIIGGILIDGFFVATGTHLLPLLQWTASNLVGQAAFTSPSYALLGLVIHLAVSTVWGLVYALLAQSGRPALVNSPVPSGLIYGFVVMLAMQTVQVIFRTYIPPSHNWGGFAISVIGHTVFFGLPVALYVSRAARRAVGA